LQFNLLQPKITKKLLLLGLKVIQDVDIFKKLVTSDRYDKQHVCAYLQSFSHYTSQQ